MAFITSAFFGGMAKRGSEILSEERQEAISNTEDEIKILTQLGLPKAMGRRSKRKEKETIFESLKTQGFNGDEIAVIMKEGTGQAVLDHIKKNELKYDNYKVRPAEIVRMDAGYEAHGYTKDQVLDLVMGKLDTGTPTLEAVDELSGKKRSGGLTGLLGGNLDNVRTKRMEAIANATGVSMSELAAYASDSIIYDDIKVKGKTRLFDPAAAAIAAKDSYSTAQVSRGLTGYASNKVVSSKIAGSDRDGPVYGFNDTEIADMMADKIREIENAKRAEKQEKGDYGPITSKDMAEMENSLSGWISTARTPSGKVIALNPKAKEDGAVSSDGPLDVTGLSLGQLEALLRDELQPQNGRPVDEAMAKAIAEQIREAMIAEAKRTGSKLTTESIDTAIQRILSSRGYEASSSEEQEIPTLEEPAVGDGITLTN
jgi:SOS response regulatory protein OraA/RecX